jgi:predicted nucleotidyltransferase component of viral defense system
MSDPSFVPIHEDIDFFRAAVMFTEAETGFNARLIEKDYFCSLMLHALEGILGHGLVFKGGTALSKIHCDFYRLSEDLDFAVSVPIDATRSTRSKAANPFRELVETVTAGSASFMSCTPLRGYNNSTQYATEVEYASVITGGPARIKLEISVREPILDIPTKLPCRVLLRDPFRKESVLTSQGVTALSLRETYAEKLRAALTRRVPAIRDFFDIDYALRQGLIQLEQVDLIEMLQCKLAIPGNSDIDMSQEKYDALDGQLLTQLRPVLREEDYASFDLSKAYEKLVVLKNRLQP